MCNIHVTSAFRPSMTSQSASWRWVHCDFNGDFEGLLGSDALTKGGPSEKLWETSQKFVLKVVAPSGRVVVYKSYHRIAKWYNFIFRPSPMAREALNYQALADLGLPMARLLAVGDDRTCFILKSGFLVTEYVSDSGDGRDFFGQGKHAGNEGLRDLFIDRVFAGLARLHDQGWIHRGATPANFLYRLHGEELEPIWIDVATCRKKGRSGLKRLIPDDFVNFFRYFDFTPAQRRQYEELYLSHASTPLFTAQELFDAVESRT